MVKTVLGGIKMTNEEHITNLSVLWERCREAKEFPATMYKLSDGQYLESLEAAIQALESQEQAIKEAYDKGYEYGVKEWFDKRPPAQTCIEDYPTCTECEHYDSEKHYCPRFCQVIKDTLAEAQQLGIAETDPTQDVEGIDAACKVVILANSVLGIDATYADVEVRGISDVSLDAINLAKEEGYYVKLIGEVSEKQLKVSPRLVKKNSPFAIDGTLNLANVTTDLADDITVMGKGAGSLETASAMLTDLINIIKNK